MSEDGRLFLIIGGHPIYTADTRRSLQWVVKRVVGLNARESLVAVHCWEGTPHPRSFFKSNHWFVWLLWQVTRPLKPARLCVEKIYQQAKAHKSRGTEVQSVFQSLGLGTDVRLCLEPIFDFSAGFCALDPRHMDDLRLRAGRAGSSNLLGFQNMPLMFMGIKRALEVSGAYLDADVVIRYRPDLVISPVDIRTYVRRIEAGSCDFISLCNHGGLTGYKDGRVPDLFFVTTRRVLGRILAELFHCDAIYEASRRAKSSGFGGEVILGESARRLDLSVEIFEGIERIERL